LNEEAGSDLGAGMAMDAGSFGLSADFDCGVTVPVTKSDAPRFSA